MMTAQEILEISPWTSDREAWAIRESVADEYVGEFDSGAVRYTFADGSALTFTGIESRALLRD